MNATRRRWPLVFLMLAIIGSGAGLAFHMMTQPVRIELTPTRTGQTEYCLTCHDGIELISAAHPLEEFGCVACHGGVGETLDEDQAHAGIVRNPGALDTAAQYCGECHAGQIALVERSLQATYAGAITHVRRTFGQQRTDVAEYAIALTGHLLAFAPTEEDPLPVQNFAANCLSCHLRTEPIEADYYHRSTGCSACHVLYGDDGRYQGGDPTISTEEAGHPAAHEFTTAIPYSQCNHCHNRGNYDMRTMQFLERDDLPPPEGLDQRQARLHDYYQPIGQFTLCEWELDCIDCHTSQEIMGDALLYDNRSQAQYTQCATCHGTLDSPPASTTITSPTEIAMTRAALNPLVDLAVGDTVIVTERDERMWHIRQDGGRWILTGKATGTEYDVPLVTGTQCQQQPDEQASHYCHECHAYDREAALP